MERHLSFTTTRKRLHPVEGSRVYLKKTLHFDLCPLSKESIIPFDNAPCELCVYSDKYLNMCICILFSKNVLNLFITTVPDLFVKLITDRFILVI